MSKKLKLLLLTSIILNIIFIGIIAGHSYRRYYTHHHRSDAIITLLDKASINEEKRLDLKEKLQKHFQRPPSHKERKKWEAATTAILTAQQFDANAYRKQLEMLPDIHEKRKEKRIDVMVELASSLNHQERVELAEIFRKRKGGRP